MKRIAAIWHLLVVVLFALALVVASVFSRRLREAIHEACKTENEI